MTADDAKRAAAARAVALVEPGMRLGLGTGSTAAHFVRLLGARARAERLDVVGVPTSEATRALAEALGLRLTTLDATPDLDLAVDGADEIDGGLGLIKGGGAALLREKIVAASAERFVVIADDAKRVDVLGRFPLPVEIVRFGAGATAARIRGALRELGLPDDVRPRMAAGAPLVTDEGHLLLDAHLGAIPDAAALARALDALPGVVEHGLFLGLATGAILGRSDAGGAPGLDVMGRLD